MCVNRVLAVLAAAALAMQTGYKLIADSENQHNTCNNKVLWLFLLQNAIGKIRDPLCEIQANVENSKSQKKLL